MPRTKSKRELVADELAAMYRGHCMAPYGLLIMEAVQDARPEDTFQIEDVMRTQYRTMDGLRWPEFRRLARLCWDAVLELRKLGDYDTPKYVSEPRPSVGRG